MSAGQILYTHTTAVPSLDQFTYRVSGPGGNSAETMVSLTFALPAHRSWQIQTSPDLQTWSPWNVPGNAALPHPGAPAMLMGSRFGDRQFFRLHVWEN